MTIGSSGASAPISSAVLVSVGHELKRVTHPLFGVGQFRFNLVTSNGQVVATSETYTHKQPALDNIESTKNNVAAALSTTRPISRPRPLI
ncbi:YegP family protein [Phytohabitans rumicis]|uniref:DUF1508 domain-containing protein n=1 Tax=Phytohabitans rumicis TaxID=1076125 RepID=A0A6V8LN09_9ACTN|nr:YegP family protein [Phytohabitans rumicis]GFJ95477.1 hypothetical protein Prum_091190 [Phytohabitans rumicis]